ncbi:MAG: biotin transporter BioY [Armatimonadota bacterium]
MITYQNAAQRFGAYIDSRHWSVSLVFTAITILTANLAIPLPHTPVPFTLQVMAVLASGLVLGARLGWLAQIQYLALGFIGAPVFAGGSAGIAYLFNPRMTGGYLLAFPLAAWICGYVAQRHPSLPGRLAACAIAIMSIYGCGLIWMHAVLAQPVGVALAWGILPFIGLDAIKGAIVSVMTTRKNTR